MGFENIFLTNVKRAQVQLDSILQNYLGLEIKRHIPYRRTQNDINTTITAKKIYEMGGVENLVLFKVLFHFEAASTTFWIKS